MTRNEPRPRSLALRNPCASSGTIASQSPWPNAGAERPEQTESIRPFDAPRSRARKEPEELVRRAYPVAVSLHHRCTKTDLLWPQSSRHCLYLMLAFQDTQPRLVHGQPVPAALLRAAVDPAVAIGMLLACVLWFDGRFEGPHLILALLVFSMTFPGSLARDTMNVGELIRDIVAGWLTIVALLLLLGWASQTLGAFDQRVILAWAFATPVGLFLAHRLVPMILPRLLAAEGLEKTCVIVGASEIGRRLADSVRTNPLLGIRFAGYFDDRGAARLAGVEPGTSLGSLSQLAEYVKAYRIDLIYITLPMTSRPRILKLLEELHDTTASIYFAPDIFLFDLIQARVATISGIPVLAVCESPFHGINGLIKRASDVVLASAILVLIAPLMAAIAIGVKLSSPGPVLFKQRRYGLDGKEILV